jgi:acetyl-CoA C-acetyltransferase
MERRRKLGRGVAIVGAGMSKFGMFRDKDSKDLFADAFKEMIRSVDKGVDPNEIDALYLGNFSNDFFINQSHWGPIISDLVGIAPKPATRTEGACASSALAMREGRFCHCFRVLRYGPGRWFRGNVQKEHSGSRPGVGPCHCSL